MKTSHKWLIAIVILPVLIWSWASLYYFVAWHWYEQEAQARHVKMVVTELAPPAVPDNENLAATPLLAHLFETPTERDESTKPFSWRRLSGTDRPGPPSTGWRYGALTDLSAWAVYCGGASNSTDAARDLQVALAKFDSEFAEIIEASHRPHARFPIRYEDALQALLPHLTVLRSASRALALRASVALAQGEPARALEDTFVALRLADALQDEPLLISGLVRVTMIELALQPIWEGLARRQWSAAQLQQIEDRLAPMNLIATGQLSLAGERAMANSMLLNPQHRDVIAGEVLPSGPLWNVAMGWFRYGNLLTLNRYHDAMSNWFDVQAKSVDAARVQEFSQRLEIELHQFGLLKIYAGMLMPALDSAAKRFAVAQTGINEARLAVGLERFHQLHLKYPANLNSLAPEFLALIPQDIVNGQPLHYRLTSNERYELWSVGWNLTDDDAKVVMIKGKSPKQDFTVGDWVWRYPPTPRE